MCVRVCTEYVNVRVAAVVRGIARSICQSDQYAHVASHAHSHEL